MKRKKNAGEMGSWMDTYGDMVTLLLCFFVLLYSISSVDQNKWINLILSLNPNAQEALEEVHAGGDETQGVETSEEQTADEDMLPAESFEELYEALMAAAETLGVQDQVTISKGDGFTFISFTDQVFFDGNSPNLKDEGKVILDGFVEAMVPAADQIKEIQVLGHTSQGSPDRPNNVMTDRVLSAERSAQIVAYIQEKNFIEPARLVGMSFGQFRPIDTFETAEGRAHNRRAEILITETGSVERSLSSYYEEVYGSDAYGEWMNE